MISNIIEVGVAGLSIIFIGYILWDMWTDKDTDNLED